MSQPPPVNELLAEAELGEEATTFLNGSLGQWLDGCAQQEVQAAQEALETVDPKDEKAITELQNKAWRARRFGQWLKELVSRGENAIQSYQQQQQRD